MAAYKRFTTKFVLAMAPVAKTVFFSIPIIYDWSALHEFKLPVSPPPPVLPERAPWLNHTPIVANISNVLQTILPIPMNDSTRQFEVAPISPILPERQQLSRPYILTATTSSCGSPRILFVWVECRVYKTEIKKSSPPPPVLALPEQLVPVHAPAMQNSSHSFGIVFTATFISLLLGFVIGAVVATWACKMVKFSTSPVPSHQSPSSNSIKASDISTPVLDQDHPVHLPSLLPLHRALADAVQVLCSRLVSLERLIWNFVLYIVYVFITSVISADYWFLFLYDHTSTPLPILSSIISNTIDVSPSTLNMSTSSPTCAASSAPMMAHRAESDLNGEKMETDTSTQNTVIRDNPPKQHQVRSIQKTDIPTQEHLCVQSQSHDHGRTINSARRIPAGVLHEIFSLCLPVCESEPKTTLDVDKFAPWKLAQVCKYWREVAVGFTRLWKEVRVHDDIFVNWETGRRDSTVFLLDMQLQRAGSEPLTIFMVIHSETKEISQAVLRRLLPTSSRWTDFAVSADKLHAFRRLVPIENRLDSLQDLSLRCDQPESITRLRPESLQASPLSRIFAKAPLLHTLRGNGECFRSLSARAMPWSQILHYHEDLLVCRDLRSSQSRPWQYKSHHTNIFHATNLRSCTVNHDPNCQLPAPLQSDKMELPALEFMKIIGIDLQNVEEWLMQLSMPVLERLSFDGPFDQLALSNVIRQFPSLVWLRLHVPSFDSFAPNLIPILKAAEGLEVLELKPTGLETVESLGRLVNLIVGRPDVCKGLEAIMFGTKSVKSFRCSTALDENSDASRPLLGSRPQLIISNQTSDW